MPNNQCEPTGLLLAHRAMLRDADRLADLTAGLAARGTPVDRKRAVAIGDYLADYCDSVHHHHSAEDEVLWPVLERSAGAHVDLTELSDDHAVLDPKLTAIRAGARALRDTGRVSAALAADVADLRTVLHEHIADEERTIVPLIRRYVPVADWEKLEATIRRRARMSFEAPRIFAVATDTEMAGFRADGGLPLALMLKVLPPAFRRRERRVFGAVH
jgi:hemerythrin-like domain-containing protein